MTEFAKLVIKVDSKQVDKATDDLEKLGYQSQVVEGKTKRATSAFKLMGGVLGALGVVEATRQFVRMADKVGNMENLLKTSAREGENLRETFSELTQTALETNSNLESTVSLYSKLKLSTQDLNLSQEQLLKFTETVNKSFIVSGASADESAGAIKQLSQALASGAFRGDEFNSVAENSPRLMMALADQLGVTIGELREMAAQGKLTSKILADSLLGQADKIASEFEKLDKTAGQGLENFTTGLTVAIGAVDEYIGLSSGLASILDTSGKGFALLAEKITESAEAQKAMNYETDAALISKYNQEIERLVKTYGDFEGSGGYKEIQRLRAEVERLQSMQVGRSEILEGFGLDPKTLKKETEQSSQILSEFIAKGVDEEFAKWRDTVTQYSQWDGFKPLGLWDDTNSETYFNESLVIPFDMATQKIEERTTTFADRIKSEMMTTGEILSESFRDFSVEAGNALAGVIMDGENLGDALKDISRSAIKQLIASFVQLGIQQIAINSLVTANTVKDSAIITGTKVAEGRAISAAYADAAVLATAATGGANLLTATTSLAAFTPAWITAFNTATASTAYTGQRAEGGSVSAGGAYRINERGDEIFVPNQNGRMVSNEDIKSLINGNGNNRNVSLSVSTAATDPDEIAQLVIRRIQQAEVI